MAETSREIWAKVIADPAFQKLAGPVADWIEGSRNHRHDPVQLLDLQRELAAQILYFQEQRREFEADERLDDEHSPMKIELEKGVAHAKRGIRIVKDIADGIAWRALSYDRLAIRQMANKPHTGALVLDSLQPELAAAIAHAERTGHVVVVNDLTNFLRFGDFTAVGDGRVTVAEIKQGRGSARSGKARKQRKKLEKTLGFLNAGVGVAPDGSPAVLLPTAARARSHMREVQQLFRESAERGCAYARLTDSLAVEVIRPELIIDQDATRIVFHNPFSQSPRCLVHHTYELFDAWSPNVAPFSIFPLAASDCAAILTGSAGVFAYLNLDNVIRCFRRRGLVAHLPSVQQIESLAHLRPGEYVHHEFDAPITVGKRGGTPFEMSLASLPRVFGEFLDEESLADQLEEVLNFPADEELLLVGVGFANEADLWD